MPIRPENRGRYPADWPEISRSIRFDRARGRCECRGECGRSTHAGRCTNHHGHAAYGTGSRVVLTVAHLDHTPEHCAPENLRAMCQACHLAYDAEHHRQTARATGRAAIEAAGQLTFAEHLPWEADHVDIADFLRARYEEDEQTARAAADETGRAWTDGGERGEHVGVVDSNDTVAVGPWTGYLPDGVRQHIARHDPARVLAEVAAKGTVLDQHPNVNDGHCGTCVVGEWGYPTHGGSSPERWPCQTVRLLALPYREHPDYQPEWAPQD